MADIDYLKGLDAVRERAHLVLGAAERNELTHFDYDPSKMSEVADFVAGVITVCLFLQSELEQRLTKRTQRDFGPDRFDQIPPHGRWQHFDVGGVARIDNLIKQWKLKGLNKMETTRRLIDLFFVAVLLDAGAGDVWTFTEPNTDNAYGRSEGIAVASLYMFKAGAFSSHEGGDVEQVDGQSL